ncbi:tetratricopeptide repeat protein [Bacillus sp. Xin]|uniref:tetratricopeptide repeat protein n=1 Tax=unclassified Bacillus (in: firmicutes) TaxID=185979 RepID=UPI0015740A6F|nr:MULTISPECIES: tetratricopeptide repeat protein [unclassified Bacillus (in: firmicutes)]MBC6975798.1 tetratricopeptide repeat protein [Bacillus sp. Xin]NSW35199.1 tetratricopeptide repeat protein [Bacillus sp. Xin1]
MNVQTKGNEQITLLLNQWYLEIRSRNLEKSTELKKEVDTKVNEMKENKELFQHYLLLNFRYDFLMDNLGVSKDSFDEIASLGVPTNQSLAYYYHFFKAIHSDAIGEYKLAKEHYEKAESLLKYIYDELEHAEFYYKLGYSYYDTYQAVLAMKYLNKAKDMFLKHTGCETNIAFCNNLLGLACTHLREYELAEEYLTSAMNTFQKIGEKKFITMAKHNLGLLYGSQDLSEVAIRYLSEVIKNSPNHYKAIFIKAREHFKLDETNIASELIEKGLSICTNLENEQYQYRFVILREMNKKVSAEELEKAVLAGMDYFKKEELWEYIQEYTEVVAVHYHNEGNFEQSSKYFYLSYKAKKEIHRKGALK